MAPERASRKNPVLPGFYPDPSLCRVGGDYYLVTSSFEYFPGVPIFHSRDLQSWRQLGHVLTRSSQLALAGAKASQGIFAPTLRHHRGTFYLITTNVSDRGNFYVTAQDPAGPWSEPIWLPEAAGWMDPSLLFDHDGRVYFTRHGGGERGAIHQAELDVEHGRLLGDARAIWSGTGGVWPEGPHLYRRGGHYYLVIAEGGTGYEHAVTVARADNPWGPFEPCPHNPVLTHRGQPEQPIQATGHAELFEDAAGQWWCAFLGIRPSGGRYHHLGRETFLAPVEWDAAGWPVINGGAPVALGSEDSAAVERDDFTGRELAPAWNFVRQPAPGCWSLDERASYLRLRGTASTLADVEPKAFVGRRQRHFRCCASAELDFEPKGGESAGLCVRANEDNHYELVVTREGDEKRALLRARRLGQSEIAGGTLLGPGAVTLTIRAEADAYTFSCTQGAAAATLGMLPTRALSTEVAGGFTGVYFGMHAASSQLEPTPADFSWFEYEG